MLGASCSNLGWGRQNDKRVHSLLNAPLVSDHQRRGKMEDHRNQSAKASVVKPGESRFGETTDLGGISPIFLVVGPPAVGKSSTSRALAARFPKSLHIPVDDLRNMVVSGILLPAAVWSDDLAQQVALARASAVHMALAYHNAGFTVVIDDFWDADHPSDYQMLLSHPTLQRIVLLPDQDEAHQRNLQRAGESPLRGYIDEGIRIVYQQLTGAAPQLESQGWLVVDTTSLSVEETVTTILLLKK
jgi:chloramphenicol 3-O-phosphotransferase